MSPCEKYLRRWYRTYNHKYFNDELPEDIDLSFARLRQCAGDCRVDEAGQFVIRVHFKRGHFRLVKFTLLHEMAHVKLHPYWAHGPQFDEEMQRLALMGAFRRLW